MSRGYHARRRVTIADVLRAYRRDRADVVISVDRLDSTIKRLRRGLGQVSARDRDAVARAVTRHVARRRRQVRDSTIRRELITLRAALRLAWKRGKLPAQPYINVLQPAPPRQRWLTPEEARQLLDRIDEPLVELFVHLALRTGARRGAILELTWDRVDFVQGAIDYHAPHPRAGRRKARAVVPMPPRLAKLLRQAQRRAPDGEPRVVPLSGRAINQRLAKAAAAAGLTGVTAHVLRHTVATWLLGERSTVSLVHASRLLGHRSVTITEQVYAHLMARHLRGAADEVATVLEGEEI